MSPPGKLYGGVEAGGTKFVCALGRGPGELEAEATFPTTSPAETLERTVAFLQQHAHRLEAVGVASFGPVDPNPLSPTYGHITSTPKPGWRDTDVAGILRRALGVPVRLDTDVNAAGLAEQRWGAARGLETFVYLTVGTGIGGGGMANGQLLHGLLHPEMGHIRIPHDSRRDPFPGACPFHGDCLEGLAAGPALQARWGLQPEALPDDHPAWPLEAHYLALAVANFICSLSPQRIVLGGGVMQRSQLFPWIRREVQQLLNGYVQSAAILSEIDGYVVPPGLGRRSGVLGAMALAQLVSAGP